MSIRKSPSILLAAAVTSLLVPTLCFAQDDSGAMEQAGEARSRQAEIDADLAQSRVESLERDAQANEVVDGVDSPDAEADDGLISAEEAREEAAEARE